jgi:DNA-directed RNA polymerase specialized sigma24 family protein
MRLMSELPEATDGGDLAESVAVRELTMRLLNTLTARQRTAVVLRYLYALPDEDVAAHLDCQLATVRSLISRAMAGMRKDAERMNAVSADPNGASDEQRF